MIPEYLRQSEIKKAHMREVGKTDRWLLWMTVGVVLLFGVLIISAL